MTAAVVERAARLAAEHPIPGQVLRTARLNRLCDVPGCTSTGVLLPRGVHCAEHRAPVPMPDPALDAEALAARPPRLVDPARYGTATTDPLGREGPGWHVSDRTRLPTPDEP